MMNFSFFFFKKNPLGWTDGSEVRALAALLGPESRAQHPYGGSQPFVTQWPPLAGNTNGAQTHKNKNV